MESFVFLPKEGIAAPILDADGGPENEGGEPHVPASPDPADHPVNLYRYPALYDAVKTPSAQDVRVVRDLMTRFCGPPPWSILDPASGPGNWLRPFCDGRNTLVGNDYCRPMVEYVAQTLGPCGCTALHGDMYRLPIVRTFDVVLEASGVTSIVPDVPTLARLLDHWAGRLGDRGVMIVLVNFTEPVPSLPAVTWQAGKLPLPGGGTAGIRYELLEDRPAQGTQLIRRTVTTQDAPGLPRFVQEAYTLRVWKPDEIANVVGQCSVAKLVATVHPDDAAQTNAQRVGERYLVFKRRS